MTLQTSDYASIAGDKTNQALALAKDPEGKTGLEALENVGKMGILLPMLLLMNISLPFG